jgi:hypothetical protein
MNVTRMCSKCRLQTVKEGQRWCWRCRKPRPFHAIEGHQAESPVPPVVTKKSAERTLVNEVNAGAAEGTKTSTTAPAAYVPFVAGRPFQDEVWFNIFLSDLAVNGSPALAAAAAGQHIDAIERHADENAAFANEIEAASRYYRELLEWQSVNVGRTKNNPLPFFARLKAEMPGRYIERQVTANLNLNADAPPSFDSRAMLISSLKHITPETRRMLLRSPEGVALLDDPEYRAALLGAPATEDGPPQDTPTD